MSDYWAGTSYGWTPIYWLTISGIPVVFSERAMGLALPAGYTSEDASLVIDDSADVGVDQVDREKGIGVGLSLSFQLLDTTAVRGWLRKFGLQTQLTAHLGHSDPTATVASTAGWPATGAIYTGLERIEYTGLGGPGFTFTGLSHGTSGSLATTHRVGTTGQIVTDLPRYWRGRDVVLWATLVDPSGYACGTTLPTAETRMIWRGRIESPPIHQPTGFAFQAKSLDRILDDTLGAKLSGRVAQGAQALVTIWPGLSLTVSILPYDAGGALLGWPVTVSIQPFEALTVGTTYAWSDLQALAIAAWAAAVPAAIYGVHVGDMAWNGQGDATIRILADATLYGLKVTSTYGLKTYSQTLSFAATAGLKSDTTVDLQGPAMESIFDGTPLGKTLALSLDDIQATDCPTGGIVLLSQGSDKTLAYSYTSLFTSQNIVYCLGVALMPGQTAPPAKADPLAPGNSQDIDWKAELWLSSPIDGSTTDVGSLVLMCLESSGTGLRGIGDLLAQGQGYGIPADLIDLPSLTDLDDEPIHGLKGQATAAEQSFVGLFGGLLGLFRFAVVAGPRPGYPYGDIMLRIVRMSPGQAAFEVITDADLLTHAGDPVTSVERMAAPNAVTVTVTAPGWDPGDGAEIIFNDVPGIESNGRQELSVDVAGMDRDQLATALSASVGGQFAFDEGVQAVELMVHPSVVAEVGDTVTLTCTHPALWTWNSNPGGPGYNGPALVVGRTMNLRTLTTTLRLLIDGSVLVHALSPAAEVTGYDSAITPTWIEVALGQGGMMLAHFVAAIEAAGGPITVIHYQPGGAESDANTFTLSAAADVGGNCRLTVSVDGSALALSTALRSTLTLPKSASATAWQRNYAHTDDGSKWV